MDAAKNGKGRQGSKMNIFENGPEMAQKLHFSNFPLTFLMVTGEIVEKYFFPTYTNPNGSLKTWISKISDSEFHSKVFHIVG